MILDRKSERTWWYKTKNCGHCLCFRIQLHVFIPLCSLISGGKKRRKHVVTKTSENIKESDTRQRFHPIKPYESNDSISLSSIMNMFLRFAALFLKKKTKVSFIYFLKN